MSDETRCVCAEIADVAGNLLSDERIKALCDRLQDRIVPVVLS